MTYVQDAQDPKVNTISIPGIAASLIGFSVGRSGMLEEVVEKRIPVCTAIATREIQKRR